MKIINNFINDIDEIIQYTKNECANLNAIQIKANDWHQSIIDEESQKYIAYLCNNSDNCSDRSILKEMLDFISTIQRNDVSRRKTHKDFFVDNYRRSLGILFNLEKKRKIMGELK